MRNSWLIGLLAASATTLLPLASSVQAAAPKTITWGIYADPSRYGVAEAQAQAFEKLNPNIRVKVQQVPFAQYYQKLGAQISAGTAYDVMMISGAYFSDLAPHDAFLPLNTFVKKSHLNLANYTTDPRNSVYGGHLYALPYELDIQALFYNKTLFNRYHVPYPNANWTWSNLLAAAQKLTHKSAGVWGFYSQDLYPSWTTFVGQAGGTILTANLKRGALTSPADERAFKFMVDLVNKYHVSPGPSTFPANVNVFQTGKVGMVVDGSYSILNDSQMIKSFQWNIAPLPHETKAATAYWTQGLAIYAHTAHPNASWKFVKFLESPKGEAILAKSNMSTPSLKSIADGPLYAKSKKLDLYAFISGYEKSGDPVQFCPNWFQIMDGPTSTIGGPLSEAWLGQTSVSAALTQAEKQTNAALAHNP